MLNGNSSTLSVVWELGQKSCGRPRSNHLDLVVTPNFRAKADAVNAVLHRNTTRVAHRSSMRAAPLHLTPPAKKKPGKPCRPGKRNCVEEPDPEPVTFTPTTAAARSGRRVGVAVAYEPLSTDAAYAQLITEQFSDISPENATKWGPLQPQSAKRWDFDQGDAMVDFAPDHELSVRGHTLIWHQQLPSFINESTRDRQLARYTRRHIERAVHHYRNDMFAWDVVNEAVADDGSGLRQTPFSDAFGEHYIARIRPIRMPSSTTTTTAPRVSTRSRTPSTS
jgi:Glycosyl hydrolase family 10